MVWMPENITHSMSAGKDMTQEGTRRIAASVTEDNHGYIAQLSKRLQIDTALKMFESMKKNNDIKCMDITFVLWQVDGF